MPLYVTGFRSFQTGFCVSMERIHTIFASVLPNYRQTENRGLGGIDTTYEY